MRPRLGGGRDSGKQIGGFQERIFSEKPKLPDLTAGSGKTAQETDFPQKNRRGQTRPQTGPKPRFASAG
jgi:hypothetical protein